MNRQDHSPLQETKTPRTRLVIGLAALLSGFMFVPACSDDETAPTHGSTTTTTTRQPLPASDGKSDEFGLLPDMVGDWKVTKGAAAGYVSDSACKECHESLWNSYQSVGMARSFYPLSKAVEVEDFGKVFFQRTTGNHYVMTKRDGKYYQSRWRVDAAGQKYAEYEQEVAWVVGSGNHVRTYVSQSEFGEMFELPLSWYTEGGWQMSPGYEEKSHHRFERVIRRECMFCHNAYPDVPLGSDLHGRQPTFPRDLPHGIGCQRCHGPGARHVELALEENAEDEAVRARIINPANFTPKQREQLCMTCHMQPDVGNGTDSVNRWFDRPTYAHRPEQSILDHVLFLDCGSAADRSTKIEVNHHAYRMQKSRCYLESPGKLDCLTCHDPHRSVPKPDRPAYYRKKCMQCHAPDDCEMEGMGTTLEPHEADCVSCHMVKARPRDVVHVTITDHLIRRKPPERDLTAARPNPPRPRSSSIEITPMFPDRAPKGALLELHKDIARGPHFVPERFAGLRKAVLSAMPDAPAAYVSAGRTLELAGDHKSALEVTRAGLGKFPDDFDLLWTLATSLHMSGLNGAALETLDKALATAKHPQPLQLRANILAQLGQLPEAIAAFEQSLALRPNHAAAWRQYGQLLARAQRPDDALSALRKAIAGDPDDGIAYVLIAEILAGRGDVRGAIRTLEQAAPLVVDAGLELIGIYLFADPSVRNPTRALSIAQSAVEKEPGNARAQLHLAFASALLNKLKTVGSAVEKARRLGADPACCTGIELLLAMRRQHASTIEKLATQFRADLGIPTTERLRGHVVGVLQGMMRQGR